MGRVAFQHHEHSIPFFTHDPITSPVVLLILDMMSGIFYILDYVLPYEISIVHLSLPCCSRTVFSRVLSPSLRPRHALPRALLAGLSSFSDLVIQPRI